MSETSFPARRIQVTALAHNEEGRIGACMNSLPLGKDDMRVSVVVNGSSDGTADVVRSRDGVELVEYEEGGKARSWNRFVLDECPQADFYVFVDGDAELLPGTVEALVGALEGNPGANAAAGMPMNGRRAAAYRKSLMEEGGGIFGDCYALSGAFVARMRDSRIRLPDDIVPEDGLIAALACTDLGPDKEWDDARRVPVPSAGFLCEPNGPNFAGIRRQAARMVNYSIGHFQNRIVSDIMGKEGPAALPRLLAELYPAYLPRFKPRLDPVWFAFDRRALALMRERSSASP